MECVTRLYTVVNGKTVQFFHHRANLKSHQPLTIISMRTPLRHVGNGSIVPLIHNLGTSGGVRFYAPAALPLGKSPRYAMNRNRSVCNGQDKIILPLPRIEPRLLAGPAHNLVTILTELCWLYISSSLWRSCTPSRYPPKTKP